MSVTCGTTGIITNGASYTQPNLNPAQQKAMLLYAMATFLVNKIGGTDYTSSMAGTLITDSTQMVCGITPDQLVAGKIAIWMEAAGLTLNTSSPGLTTITSKLSAVNCLVNADPSALAKAEVFLTCKILAGLGF